MRKLKVIGVAVLAVLAVSALSAASANAATETPAKAKVTGSGAFTATQTAGKPHNFTLPGGRTLSCATATFSGVATNGASVVAATPAYGTCHTNVAGTTLKASVDVTSCKYEFYDLTTAGAANTYAAKTDLVCPGMNEAIHIVVRAANDKEDLCRYTVDPQGPLTGVHFTDNAGNTLNITATNVGVVITKTFGTVGNCGAASSNSLYNGDTLVTPAAGVTIDIEEVID